jgi:hypothetical protein
MKRLKQAHPPAALGPCSSDAGNPTTLCAHRRGESGQQMKVIDGEEIALVIAKACLGVSPPPGLTPRQALDELMKIDADTAAGFRRAAVAVAYYFADKVGVEIIEETDKERLQ